MTVINMISTPETLTREDLDASLLPELTVSYRFHYGYHDTTLAFSGSDLKGRTIEELDALAKEDAFLTPENVHLENLYRITRNGTNTVVWELPNLAPWLHAPKEKSQYETEFKNEMETQ